MNEPVWIEHYTGDFIVTRSPEAGAHDLDREKWKVHSAPLAAMQLCPLRFSTPLFDRTTTMVLTSLESLPFNIEKFQKPDIIIWWNDFERCKICNFFKALYRPIRIKTSRNKPTSFIHLNYPEDSPEKA